MPDYLRLFALFGIGVVNVQYIGFSLAKGMATPVAQTLSEMITLLLVDGLATYKSYSLFSVMFGVGFGYLMRSAEQAGLAFGTLYRNRMIGLFMLGVLHGCLFFPGDILLAYAITGALLYTVRGWSQRRLIAVGAALVGLSSLGFSVFVTAPTDVPPQLIAWEKAVMTSGSFAESIAFRTVAFGILLPFLLVFQGVAVFGWFCLGLVAVRSGLIDRPNDVLWARARRWCLWPGVVLSLGGAWLLHVQGVKAGSSVLVLAAPVATLGYLGAIAALASHPPGPAMARLLRAGGSSLSVYLGQSIILSTVFSAYGFSLWETTPRIWVVMVAILVTLGLITGVSLWCRVFRLGPFEWVLRRITYAGQRRA